MAINIAPTEAKEVFGWKIIFLITIFNFEVQVLNLMKHWWHHHQDGKSLFPVPTKIHNATEGGFSHTGGKTVINRDLEGLFDGPIFKLWFSWEKDLSYWNQEIL